MGWPWMWSVPSFQNDNCQSTNGIRSLTSLGSRPKRLRPWASEGRHTAGSACDQLRPRLLSRSSDRCTLPRSCQHRFGRTDKGSGNVAFFGRCYSPLHNTSSPDRGSRICSDAGLMVASGQPGRTPRNRNPSGWRTEGKSARLAKGMPSDSPTWSLGWTHSTKGRTLRRLLRAG
jgi:hypothetical protein